MGILNDPGPPKTAPETKTVASQLSVDGSNRVSIKPAPFSLLRNSRIVFTSGVGSAKVEADTWQPTQTIQSQDIVRTSLPRPRTLLGGPHLKGHRHTGTYPSPPASARMRAAHACSKIHSFPTSCPRALQSRKTLVQIEPERRGHVTLPPCPSAHGPPGQQDIQTVKNHLHRF